MACGHVVANGNKVMARKCCSSLGVFPPSSGVWAAEPGVPESGLLLWGQSVEPVVCVFCLHGKKWFCEPLNVR